MAVNDSNPGTPSSAYFAMAPIWAKVDAVLAGTDEMRRKGSTYLPRHELESDIDYQERLKRSTLLNMTELTLGSWVGRPFSDPVERKDVPPQMDEILDDVNLQGDAVGTFARNWFREGIAKAFAHVLVDYPPEGEAPGLRPRSYADDLGDNRRPYWCFVRPENLIAAFSVVQQGREVLTHVRIRETETVRDGWSEKTVDRIRVFDHDPATKATTWDLYELQDKRWVRLTTESQKIEMNRIPLVTFYADRRGLMLGKPPLEDLVDLNIEHWQSKSDQIAVLTVSRFAVMAVAGAEASDVEKVGLGPKSVLSTRSEQGKWYYVEHSGRAIEAGRQDLLDLEERMAHYGAQFLKKRPGSETATARALDSAEATSPLQDAVVRFNDALAEVMGLTARWLDIDPAQAGTVAVVTDLGPEAVEEADFNALNTARTGRDISRKTYLTELKRRAVLGDDFDFDQNEMELEGETLTGETDEDLDPEQGGAPPPRPTTKPAPPSEESE